MDLAASERNVMRLLICRLLVMVVPLAGCAGSMDSTTQTLFAQPGKFRFLPCKDLAARAAATAKREQELTSLIDRANQGPGGSIISPMVYGPDLQQARADARELQQTQQDKHCNAGAGPAGPALR